MRLDTSKNKEFTALEKKCIKNLCARHGIDIFNVIIIRNEGLTWRGNVACFSILHPNTVYLCIDQPNICELIPYIGHEIVHRNQYLSNKAWYIIKSNPLWRRWTIEPEAYKEEDRINKEMGL